MNNICIVYLSCFDSLPLKRLYSLSQYPSQESFQIFTQLIFLQKSSQTLELYQQTSSSQAYVAASL